MYQDNQVLIEILEINSRLYIHSYILMIPNQTSSYWKAYFLGHIKTNKI